MKVSFPGPPGRMPHCTTLPIQSRATQSPGSIDDSIPWPVPPHSLQRWYHFPFRRRRCSRSRRGKRWRRSVSPDNVPRYPIKATMVPGKVPPPHPRTLKLRPAHSRSDNAVPHSRHPGPSSPPLSCNSTIFRTLQPNSPPSSPNQVRTCRRPWRTTRRKHEGLLPMSLRWQQKMRHWKQERER